MNNLKSRVASFAKKQQKIAVFNDGSLSDSLSSFPVEDGITKKALVAVEGTFDDSIGNSHTFSIDRLNTIADHTNKALQTGNTIPVCQDHEKTVGSTVGSVEGAAFVKPITESDLPNQKATHLLGKMGLFLEDVHIKAKDAVSKVTDGIVTSVSMGLNLDPRDHRIMELSLVPIPAIPNMGLFKHQGTALFNSGGVSDIDKQSFTWEDLEQNSLAMEELKEEFEDLTEQLWTLLENIYTSDALPINDINVLKQYVYSALNGYSIRVMDLLGLNDIPQPGMDATASMDAAAIQQQQQIMRDGVAMPSEAQAFGKNTKGLINFRKNVTYLR